MANLDFKKKRLIFALINDLYYMAEIDTPYLNLQTDFGFKFVFGSIGNK